MPRCSHVVLGARNRRRGRRVRLTGDGSARTAVEGAPPCCIRESIGRISETMSATTDKELDLDVTLNNKSNIHSPTIIHAPISCPSTSIRVAGAAFSPPRAWTE